jgi:CheY-like chemotaxis protein
VWAVEDGAQALALLRSGRRPSLILLDLMMPRMNGWKFLEEQRADPGFSQVPVVVMSAAASPLPTNITAAINKPFAVSEILDVVARHAA